ncbi:MAG: gluconolactonase [Leptolyngbya sp. ERB_1_1]
MTEAIEVYDDRMWAIVYPNAELKRIADGAVWSEGPVYFHEDDSVVWSDAHGNRLLRWSAADGVSVLRDPSHYQSGNYRDQEGRLVSCSAGDRAIIRREHNGEWITLVDRYQGKRFNSPNDLVVKRDGTIWFTDPPYGLRQPNQGYGGNEEQAGSFVYRFDPATGEIDPVITEMERPNGLAFSPDESLLYVSDTSQFDYPQGHHYIRVYDVIDGRWAENGRVFVQVEPGQPDGFRFDELGNLFTTSEDSVQVFAPDKTRLGKIRTPETCANLTFGGQNRDRLFIAAGSALYEIDLNTRGVQH